jgi:hypothetical protein
VDTVGETANNLDIGEGGEMMWFDTPLIFSALIFVIVQSRLGGAR